MWEGRFAKKEIWQETEGVGGLQEDRWRRRDKGEDKMSSSLRKDGDLPSCSRNETVSRRCTPANVNDCGNAASCHKKKILDVIKSIFLVNNWLFVLSVITLS